MNNEIITISLPSLIHRIGGEQTKKARQISSQNGCVLKRVRRSRNWQVDGTATSLNDLLSEIKGQEPETMAFLIKKLSEALSKHGEILEPLGLRLQKLIIANPAITLAELMEITNCTLTEARTARFESEVF